MSINDNDFLLGLRESFIQEVHDLLLMISDILLDMEKGDPDKKHLEKIIRFFHNIKGSASAVDFPHLATFCHKVEDLLVAIRIGNLPMCPEIMDLLFKSTDELKNILNKLNSNHDFIPDFGNFEIQITDIIHKNQATLPQAKKDSETKIINEENISNKNLMVMADTEEEKVVAICENIAEELVFVDINNKKSLLMISEPLSDLAQELTEKNPKLSEHVRKLQEDLVSFIMTDKVEEHYYNWYKEITRIIDTFRSPVRTIKINENITDVISEMRPEEEDTAIVFEVDQKLLDDFLADASEQLELVDSNLIILENFPDNFEALDSVFRCYHTIKSSSAILQFHEIEKLSHKMENLLTLLRDGKIKFQGEVEQLTLECFNLLKKRVDEIKRGQVVSSKEIKKEFKKIMFRIDEHQSDGSVKKAQEIHNINENDGVGTKSEEEAGEVVKENNINTSSTPIDNMIKVSIERLDRLIDTIGELVIAESMVSQSPDLNSILADSTIFKHLGHLNKITRSLQEIGMSLRMVPLKQTFKKLIRIIRDVSKGLNKEVNYLTFGEETEVDKTVVDKINDPLVHMVRNSLDHGIECNTEERLRLGKATAGQLEIRACHKGGNIWIEIKDDGRGLDKDKIVKKAIEKKLIKPGQILSEKDIFALIFKPGFSTAEKVTGISGRGVGMDVVRRNIEELHGHIDIESEKGKGTTFKIRIPNTLAIIEGMVIIVDKERYIIPTQYIDRAIKINSSQISRPFNRGNEMVILDNENLPLFKLGGFYNVNNPMKSVDDGIVLILDDSGKRIALLVDQILKKQQFVIKQLNSMVNRVPGISGGTIMSDGKVGLILDAAPLIQGFVSEMDNNNNNKHNSNIKNEITVHK
ncbi:MAG: chemotaxis protein CheA [Oligoflexia bacterium]|nr:chemotaxis protein CheA [Oligoflexia bacterium]